MGSSKKIIEEIEKQTLKRVWWQSRRLSNNEDASNVPWSGASQTIQGHSTPLKVQWIAFDENLDYRYE